MCNFNKQQGPTEASTLVGMPTYGQNGSTWCTSFGAILLSFTYLVFGVAVLTLGILLNSDFNLFLKAVNFNFRFSYILICMGVLLIFTFLLGCIGVFRECKYFLSIFVLMLLVIFTLQVTVLIGGQELKNHVNVTFEINETILKYNFTNKNDQWTQIWDNVQQELHCCGINNSSDWKNIDKKPPPISCCKNVTNNCVNDPKNIYEVGCAVKLNDFFNTHLNYVKRVLILLLIIQVIGLGSSCFLIGKFRREYEILM